MLALERDVLLGLHRLDVFSLRIRWWHGLPLTVESGFAVFVSIKSKRVLARLHTGQGGHALPAVVWLNRTLPCPACWLRRQYLFYLIRLRVHAASVEASMWKLKAGCRSRVQL